VPSKTVWPRRVHSTVRGGNKAHLTGGGVKLQSEKSKWRTIGLLGIVGSNQGTSELRDKREGREGALTSGRTVRERRVYHQDAKLVNAYGFGHNVRKLQGGRKPVVY